MYFLSLIAIVDILISPLPPPLYHFVRAIIIRSPITLTHTYSQRTFRNNLLSNHTCESPMNTYHILVKNNATEIASVGQNQRTTPNCVRQILIIIVHKISFFIDFSNVYVHIACMVKRNEKINNNTVVGISHTRKENAVHARKKNVISEITKEIIN